MMPPAPRILMTADAVGGVWTYALELTRAMPEIDFVLATMGPAPSTTQATDLPPNVKLVVAPTGLMIFVTVIVAEATVKHSWLEVSSLEPV